MRAHAVSSLVSLSLALVVAGCSKDAPAPSPAAKPSTSAAAATPAPSAPASVAASGSAAPAGDRGGREFRGGGPASMLLRATKDLDLKPPQKEALGKIEEKLRSGDSPRDEVKELEAELAAQVKAGKLDTAKLAPKHAAIEKAVAAQQVLELETITSLHGALEPAQRTALVAAVRAKQAQREEKLERRKEDKDEKAKREDPAARLAARVERMAKDLDLDAAQKKTVEAFLAKNAGKVEDGLAEAKKRMDALLTAFEKEKFDGKGLDLLAKKGGPGGHLEMEEGLLTALLPALKPEQREKLAAKIERMGGRKGRFEGPR